ncbi:MAG: hypothetical protein AYK18_13495 [Theionarchaea archaeon DG-70]|nr:MAG: hypothetical protein AYK18_13495 [Theionarchaea archaeon DG-70]
MDCIIGNQSSKIHGGFLESIWADFYQLFAMDIEERKKGLLGLDITPEQLKRALDYLQNDQPSSDIVALVECTSYENDELNESIFHSIDLLKVEEQICSCKEILIKPNFIEARFPCQHATTHPAFLEALICVLRNYTNKKIIVGEGSGHERDTALVLQNTGLSDVLKKCSVKFVDLNYDDIVLVDVPNPLTLKRIPLPKSITSADIVISAPKLKTHHWTGVSLGMKNLLGVFPGSLCGHPKNRLHWASLPRAIADLVSVIKPELTIIDGIVGIEGNGPLDGVEKKANVIISGTNVFSTDIAACNVMGFLPVTIPKFWFCSLKEIGSPSPRIKAKEIKKVVDHFLPPPVLGLLMQISKNRNKEIMDFFKDFLNFR